MMTRTIPPTLSCSLPAEHVPLNGVSDLSMLPLGAHLVTPRRRYVHHGIYAGSGWVVHYAGLCHSLKALPIEEVPLEHFARGQLLAYLPATSARFNGEAAVRRARSRLGEDAYDLLNNNCEHSCTWCLDGQPRSEQVDRMLALPNRLKQRVLARLAPASRELEMA